MIDPHLDCSSLYLLWANSKRRSHKYREIWAGDESDISGEQLSALAPALAMATTAAALIVAPSHLVLLLLGRVSLVLDPLLDLAHGVGHGVAIGRRELVLRLHSVSDQSFAE